MIFRTSFLVLVISAITSLASAIPQTETGQGAKVPSVEELIGALEARISRRAKQQPVLF